MTVEKAEAGVEFATSGLPVEDSYKILAVLGHPADPYSCLESDGASGLGASVCASDGLVIVRSCSASVVAVNMPEVPSFGMKPVEGDGSCSVDPVAWQRYWTRDAATVHFGISQGLCPLQPSLDAAREMAVLREASSSTLRDICHGWLSVGREPY